MYKVPCTNCSETLEIEFWNDGGEGPIFRGRCAVSGTLIHFFFRPAGWTGHTPESAKALADRLHVQYAE